MRKLELRRDRCSELLSLSLWKLSRITVNFSCSCCRRKQTLTWRFAGMGWAHFFCSQWIAAHEVQQGAQRIHVVWTLSTCSGSFSSPTSPLCLSQFISFSCFCCSEAHGPFFHLVNPVLSDHSKFRCGMEQQGHCNSFQDLLDGLESGTSRASMLIVRLCRSLISSGFLLDFTHLHWDCE